MGSKKKSKKKKEKYRWVKRARAALVESQLVETLVAGKARKPAKCVLYNAIFARRDTTRRGDFCPGVRTPLPASVKYLMR